MNYSRNGLTDVRMTTSNKKSIQRHKTVTEIQNNQKRTQNNIKVIQNGNVKQDMKLRHKTVKKKNQESDREYGALTFFSLL